MELGLTVTLRGEKMYAFLTKSVLFHLHKSVISVVYLFEALIKQLYTRIKRTINFFRN